MSERSDPARAPRGEVPPPSLGRRVAGGVQANLVPLLFAAISGAGVALSSRSIGFFAEDVVARSARNAFIVLSLVVPITAGLGLNFGIVLGAMAGQVGVIVAENYGLRGVPGICTAAAISVPLSTAFGIAAGACMNLARGREMVAGLILGFFANGLYQLAFLLLAGPVIPLRNPALLLPQGVGLRNMIDLDGLGGALPQAAVFVLILGLALFLVWLERVKLGYDLRAVGRDGHASEALGIRVGRTRIVAMVISTVLGGLGMILFLQDLGALNTYQSHEQVGFYAIAALLVGGASVERATIFHALAGTVLFHTLIPVLTQVGQERLGAPQIGEYLREFAAYTIIGATLGIHAWKKSRTRRSTP